MATLFLVALSSADLEQCTELLETLHMDDLKHYIRGRTSQLILLDTRTSKDDYSAKTFTCPTKYKNSPNLSR